MHVTALAYTPDPYECSPFQERMNPPTELRPGATSRYEEFVHRHFIGYCMSGTRHITIPPNF